MSLEERALFEGEHYCPSSHSQCQMEEKMMAVMELHHLLRLSWVPQVWTKLSLLA